ncbi:MAG: MFS transporter [Beijerinckiaceae bacterium]
MSGGKAAGGKDGAGIAIGAAIACVSIVGIGLSLTFTVIALRLEEAGFSARAIGLHSAAAGLATIAAAPFVPILARLFGLRPVLLASLALCAASLAAFAFTENYWTWLAIRIVFSAALTVLFVLSEFWINAAAPEAKRGLVLGIYAASLAAGFAAGPLLLTLTGVAGGVPFGAAVVLFGLAALPVSLVGGRAPKLENPAAIPVLLFVRSAPVATLAALVYGGVETAALGLLPVYALRSGLDAKTGAALVSLFALGNVGFQIPIGFISDRADRWLLLLIIAAAGACGAVLLPFLEAAHFAAFCALVFVWGGVLGGLYAVGLAALGARYHSADLASANAAFILLYAIGMLIAPPALGFGLDITPAGLFFGVAALLAAYCCVGLWQGRDGASRQKLPSA